MDFDPAQNLCGIKLQPWQCSGVQPKILHCAAQGDAIAVAHVQRGHVECSGQGAGAHQGCRKSHAFLVRECQNLYRERQGYAFLPQLRQREDWQNDSHDPVICAALAHRILMRPHQKRRRAHGSR